MVRNRVAGVRIFQHIAIIAVLVGLPHAGAAGEGGSTPTIVGAVAFEIQNDAAFDSDDESNEFNNLFAKVEPSFTITVLEGVSINAGLVLEPVQAPPVSGDDRIFYDQGFFVEVLTLNFDADWYSLFGGKMHVNFGSAWDVTPGVFGTDLAEEYEMAENIGVGGSLTHDFKKAGKHTLMVQAFFLDTAGLAESAFTRRKKTRESDGGPGNTGDFSSFAISLDGGEVPELSGLRYHLSYVHQGNDSIDAKSETRCGVTGEYRIGVTDQIEAVPFVEYVRFGNADGTADQTRYYLTAALALTYRNWNMAFSGTFKETEDADGIEIEEEQLQVSAGYVFPLGISLDLAYKRVRNAGIDTDVFGTLLAYTLEF